jgi:hypothetical protein
MMARVEILVHSGTAVRHACHPHRLIRAGNHGPLPGEGARCVSPESGQLYFLADSDSSANSASDRPCAD